MIKKYGNKKEREQHLHGYCQKTSLEKTDRDKNRLIVVAFSQDCGYQQLMKATVLAES